MSHGNLLAVALSLQIWLGLASALRTREASAGLDAKEQSIRVRAQVREGATDAIQQANERNAH
ncbi:MAG: hypothetical protein ACHP7E_06900, partial [Burkholderiales bacterium]